MRAAMAVGVALMATGCASILTGTRQTIQFSSQPASTAVVVSGLPAEVLLKAQQVSSVKDAAVLLLAPLLPEEASLFLQALTPDEVLTVLMQAVNPPAEAGAFVGSAGALYARTPASVRNVVQQTLFIAATGSTPFSFDLKKGQAYAVLSWAPGRKAHLVGVETRFNWVTLLNIFTAGLGLIVDVATGAWFNLHPTTLEWNLPPEPTAL